MISAVHAAADIERMSGLAAHVAATVARRRPQPVLPDGIAGYYGQMGTIGCALARKAALVLRTRNGELAAEMESDDDAMDDLHRHMFSVLMSPGWSHGVEAAIDVTLLARFYERYGDHAVAVARRVVYIVTGRMPSPAGG